MRALTAVSRAAAFIAGWSLPGTTCAVVHRVDAPTRHRFDQLPAPLQQRLLEASHGRDPAALHVNYNVPGSFLLGRSLGMLMFAFFAVIPRLLNSRPIIPSDMLAPSGAFALGVGSVVAGALGVHRYFRIRAPYRPCVVRYPATEVSLGWNGDVWLRTGKLVSAPKLTHTIGSRTGYLGSELSYGLGLSASFKRRDEGEAALRKALEQLARFADAVRRGDRGAAHAMDPMFDAQLVAAVKSTQWWWALQFGVLLLVAMVTMAILTLVGP